MIVISGQVEVRYDSNSKTRQIGIQEANIIELQNLLQNIQRH